ncbi:protein phosphatase 2C domain-containing protein [Zoogloea sp.]|uniref:PP2C family protein-serine/threonine phosphatase n=1 Tax=Zoogloea sp. TaxID=49181 RepID=UPI0031FC3ADE
MASHVGQVRLRNEDRVASDAGRGLAVLADGMGGHAGGAEAALIAVAAWMERMTPAGAAAAPQVEDLREAIFLANSRVRSAAAADPGLRGMGSTLVGACFRADGSLLYGHVGDSRLYQLRDGVLRSLTRDHSVLRAQWDAGMIDAGSPGTALLRGLLTRAVGVDEQVEPDVAVLRLEPEDIYLLCSDGLTDMVTDADIAEVLATLGVNPPLAAEHLIDLANDRGGMDNVSVIVVSSCAAMRLGTELG